MGGGECMGRGGRRRVAGRVGGSGVGWGGGGGGGGGGGRRKEESGYEHFDIGFGFWCDNTFSFI